MPVHFILVEPARPANVGAAARALKTMGFNSLRIVNSPAGDDPEAGWVAHGADDVLGRARRFATLAASIADCDLVIGTTARGRGTKRHYHPPEALSAIISAQQGVSQDIALVFGREDSGLSNAELACCDLLSYVPLAVSYPSLNLAQAVMIYSYALSGLNQRLDLNPDQAIAPEAQLAALKERVAQVLTRLELGSDDKLHTWSQDRLGLLHTRDVHMLHTLCTDLLNKLD